MSSTLSDALAATATATDPDVSSSGEEELNCGSGGGSDEFLGLRVAAIFIVLIASSFGAFFPIIASRSRLANVLPKGAFEFAKYFGSGVIIATAFIHLLDPAIEALGSECLTGTWQEYPWALAICMLSIFCIFFVELSAFRYGSSILHRMGMAYDAHGHEGGASLAAHGPEAPVPEHDCETSVAASAVQNGRQVNSSDSISSAEAEKRALQAAENGVVEENSDIHHGHSHDPGHDHEHHVGGGRGHHHEQLHVGNSVLPQLVGIFTLEFGIVLHSVLLGLTLAVDETFKVLFVVVVFHQFFEGLGLGSRLSYLPLPAKYHTSIPYASALLFGLTTPVGLAAGLGVRSSYNPGSMTASAVSGILDSISSGVLIYTGLVELLAHEFLFNPEMARAPAWKVAYACGCMTLGAALMALLGKWA